METGESINKREVDQGMNKFKEEEILEVTWEQIKILKNKTVEESTKEVKVTAEVEIGTGLGKDHFQETLVNDRNNRSTSNNRSESGSRVSTNGDRIWCYKCREYDHFTEDHPTSREEKELEHLQQMLNLDGEQTSLKSLATITHGNLNKITSEEDLRMGQ